nr:hypothetical protein [uncultured Deefgea sp.]
MASFQQSNHASNSPSINTKEQLSNEVTTQLQKYLELCANLRIDFYDCLAHARIEYDKNHHY